MKQEHRTDDGHPLGVDPQLVLLLSPELLLAIIFFIILSF